MVYYHRAIVCNGDDAITILPSDFFPSARTSHYLGLQAIIICKGISVQWQLATRATVVDSDPTHPFVRQGNGSGTCGINCWVIRLSAHPSIRPSVRLSGCLLVCILFYVLRCGCHCCPLLYYFHEEEKTYLFFPHDARNKFSDAYATYMPLIAS
jgi:hypothetical protein